jgi:hypothetical protein
MSIIELANAVLVAGDFLSREEFLKRWEESPQIKFAELIRGVVYMPSPLSHKHGIYDGSVGGWLFHYAAATPGCESGHNMTWLMPGEETPQPDNSLCIKPEFGGRFRVDKKGLAVGAPEFLAEICLSSTSFDLHQKLEVYEESGVQEYLAVLVRSREVRWHRLTRGRFKVVPTPTDGVHRSKMFPGLWLDVEALLAEDRADILTTLQRGIATPDHAAFVAKLAAQRKS